MAIDSKTHQKKLHKDKIGPGSGSVFEIFMSLGLGGLIGFLTLAFIKLLNEIERFHQLFNQKIPYHLILIPFVLIVIELIKRNTLYFPLKLAQLSSEQSSRYWTIFMTPLHFFGTLLSHFSGVSVGREGATVLFSAGIVRVFKMDWIFWGPIVSSMGFSAVVGQFWVAPFFMMELFERTSLIQKIYSLIGASVAVLVLKTFNTLDLFTQYDISNLELESGFFRKMLFLFFFAICAGYLMRFYKKVYFLFTSYFKLSSLWLKIFVSFVLAIFLYLPEFRKYQSLGIYQFTDLQNISGSFLDVLCKLFFTLVSTTVGFMGGEFIPLIYSGVNFGNIFFSYFGYNSLLGSLLGAFLLFAGATRFKWTSYLLILNLMGLNWWFWAYYVASIAIQFSGDKSIYQTNNSK